MNKKLMLQMLNEEVRKCEKCSELASTRIQTVFDSGCPDAKMLFLAEAPGDEENKKGEVLIGRAGQLLTNIIKACNLDRSKDVYLCNILKCRPPGNRRPTPQESCNCEPFLKLQIKIINPKVIVCLGATATNNLLKIEKPIGQMRRQWFNYTDEPVNAAVLCTYHPSYALRQNSAKKEIYDDLQLVINKLKET